MLKQGLVCNEVAALQFALNRLTSGTPKLVCDGIFGPLTFARVQQHQRQQNLQPDGIAGPLTMATLFERARLRARITFERMQPPPQVRAAFPVLAPVPGGPRRPPMRLDVPKLEFPKLGPPHPGPDLSVWLNPALAELARQQAAFEAWWNRPHPKPPLPEIRPRLGWFPGGGGFHFPLPHQQVVIPGRPLPVARAMLAAPKEGRDYTISLTAGGGVEPGKQGPHFKEFELEVELEWPMLKNRVKGLTLGASLSASTDGKSVGYAGKGTLSLCHGELQLFDRGVLEAATEIAAATVWEGRALGAELELTQKIQLDLRITGKPDRPGLHAVVGLGTGGRINVPIVSFGPASAHQDRQEDQKVRITPLVEGTLGLKYLF